MTFAGSRLALAALFIVANVLLAGAAAAQDTIQVGSATADGPTVAVPVHLHDASGTPLGMDRPPASRIQAFSITVNYSPASAVSSVTFTRAGVTSGLTPVFETSPGGGGSVSILASFQQSTNPISFTLDGGAPGDLIADLVFTLSPDATPGSDITLSLDAETTQLTDEGGSGATKETAGNGGLALIDGSIHVPMPSLSLTPPARTVQEGSETTFAIHTGMRLVAPATVTLSSSDPSVASVPASVNLPAGNLIAEFSVSALSPGSATITATLPSSAGGATASAQIAVAERPDCPVPAAPRIDGPATVLAGTAYDITWAAVENATEYWIDESSDPAFSPATSRTTSATSTSYSHPAAGTRYYYRVWARNRLAPCDELSLASNTASVLITNVAASLTRYFPVVGSAPGSQGSYFKTALQLYNPKAATISGRLVFHPQAVSGSATDPALAFAIPAGKTLAYADLLPAMGVASGLGTVDLIGDEGSPLPVAIARIFNDGGAAGTSGFAIEAMASGDALMQGDTGVLLAPPDLQKFRFNIGVRTLDRGATVQVTVRDRDGVVIATLTRSYPPAYFTQTSAAGFLDGFALTGGETVSLEMTGGSLFVYGATTDGITNDPSVQLAKRIE